MMWVWSVPGAGASGVTDGEAAAKRKAGALMRASGTGSGTAREVRLVVGAGMLSEHVPVGISMVGTLGKNGRVRWALEHAA